jgi:hypothetical protein
MKQEPTGWNYKDWNPTGKNVYFFRDTNHVSENIQEKLLNELEIKLQEKRIHTIFCEGKSGKYNVFFGGGEEEVKDYISILNGCWSAIEILYQRIVKREDNCEVYGVEDQKTLKEHFQISGAIIDLKMKGQNVIETSRYDNLVKKNMILVDKRSIHSARKTINLMNKKGIKEAGIIFGNAHYEKMRKEFQKEKIGCASFFPGQSNQNPHNLDRLIKSYLNI